MELTTHEMEMLLIHKHPRMIDAFQNMPKPLFLEWICSDELSFEGFDATLAFWKKYRSADISINELASAMNVDAKDLQKAISECTTIF